MSVPRIPFSSANSTGISTIPVGSNAPNGTSIDLSGLQALAGDPSALVDELNSVLMHGSMSTPMHDSVVAAVNAVASSNPLLRAQQALYLVATSSQYQVQK